MSFYYLLALLFSLSGLLFADYRFKLALFANKRLGVILLIAVSFFLIWDIVGIALGVFSTNQAWVSGWHVVTPNLPVEEFLFLALLTYVTLLTWRAPWLRMR